MPGSIVPLPVMLDEEDQKVYDRLEPPKTIVVRYGYQKKVAELPYRGDAKPGCGSKLVIRTDRGIELGEMLTTTCPNSGCYKSVSRQDMLDYIKHSGGKDYPFTTRGKVVRVATIDDLNEQSRLDTQSPEYVRFCNQQIAELGLEMKLVEVEHLLGGERVVFYYTAEDRVDFRELVKRLAAEYHTRIEMVQVNAREEARLVADYEKCGQYCCCKNFLKVLKPISMRSAKVQKATLDPQKISGRCGRLMCCLRYEDQTYEDLRKRLPHRKTRVLTDDGEGFVLNTQILTQLVLVSLDNGMKPQAYPLENIEILPPQKGGKGKDKEKPRGGESRGPDSGQQGEEKKEGSSRRRRRRRPKPGQPLKDNEVESKEGAPASRVEGAAAPEGAPESQEGGDKPKRKRRRRRRRKPRGDKGPGGEGGGSDSGSRPDSGGPPPASD